MAVHFCAPLAGYTLHQYSTNPEILAASVVRYFEQFNPDAVWLSADTWVSAEAMGAPVTATDPHQRSRSRSPRVQTAADIDRIPPPTSAVTDAIP